MVNIEFTNSERQYGIGPLFRATVRDQNWHTIEDLVESHDLITIVRWCLNQYGTKNNYKVNGRIILQPFKTAKALCKQIETIFGINVDTAQ